PRLGGAARGGDEAADLGRVRLPFAADQCHAPSPQPGRRALQPAYAWPRHGLLHSRRAARRATRHRITSPARWRRLLSDLRLAFRPHGYRWHTDVAAHDA